MSILDILQDRRDLARLKHDLDRVLNACSTGIRSAVPENTAEVFYEGCYCLFAVQNPARNTVKAVDWLQGQHAYDRVADGGLPAERIAENIRGLVRFHNVKARRTVKFRGLVGGVHARMLSAENGPPADLRRWLVETVDGYGMKEASHFLRNLGFRDVAILDVHVLRRLGRLGLIAVAKGKAITPKRYLEAEKSMREYARAMYTTLDHLDVLWWSQASGGFGR